MAPRITKDEQGGKIVLAFSLMLAYTIISVAIRLHTRWPWNKLFKREDAVLLIATAVTIGYTATLALAVENGYGTRYTERTTAHVSLPDVERTISVSFVLLFLAEGLGTISYGLFLVSLAEDDGGHRVALEAGCFLEAVFTGVAIIVASVYAARRESLSAPIWITFGVIQGAILLLLFSSIASMLLVSRMHWWKKTRAILWFGLSLLLIGAIVVRLTFTPANIFHAGFTADTIDLLIIMIVEMHFHIINATYPNLLVFAEKATTGFIISGAPRNDSITALPRSQASRDSEEKRSFSLSQRLKFLSRHSPDKSQTQSRSSETEAGGSQDSGFAGD
ncbi:hypothetical protein M409DRAFT_28767 [Zasmidium cellare ATCC 36951]|uniref:Uncharacterized protein n=1 Tax=Zasmidium cellare ATCC 36951 TaxID=1080233 RepID=A0A6A6C1F1_ZASCE|nr:uncharacterized protein M409DRAFT_28767 [Zasmidium cellare ATCC 36951]KAF2160887.1 hypothetical protein M409DRAFT_28767 [Zasmidium cellare ATCC 36951]